MSRTRSFRAQHDKVLQDLTELEKMAASGKYAGCVMALARLAGKVRVHLAVEDKSLYPSLLSHSDAAVANMAKAFQTEMGGLAGGFDAFIGKWRADASIKSGSGNSTKS